MDDVGTVQDSQAQRFVVEPASEEFLRERFPERWAQAPFVANSMRIMARDPEVTGLMLQLCRAVLRKDRLVPLGLKFLAGHLASMAAGCRYCSVHSVTLAAHDAGVEVEKIEALWAFETSELFAESERVVFRWALAAGSVPNAVTREHYEALHLFYSDDEIVEIAEVLCLYGWFNRWNDTFMTPLEDIPLEFGQEHLESAGWKPGRHREATTSDA